MALQEIQRQTNPDAKVHSYEDFLDNPNKLFGSSQSNGQKLKEEEDKQNPLRFIEISQDGEGREMLSMPEPGDKSLKERN